MPRSLRGVGVAGSNPVTTTIPLTASDFRRLPMRLDRAAETGLALAGLSCPDSETHDIHCQWSLLFRDRFRQRSPILSSTFNVRLTDALRTYVDERASDKDVYATPSEYIRDLIRQDMQDRAVALNIVEGLEDLRHGRFSDKSILDSRMRIATECVGSPTF